MPPSDTMTGDLAALVTVASVASESSGPSMPRRLNLENALREASDPSDTAEEGEALVSDATLLAGEAPPDEERRHSCSFPASCASGVRA